MNLAILMSRFDSPPQSCVVSVIWTCESQSSNRSRSILLVKSQNVQLVCYPVVKFRWRRRTSVNSLTMKNWSWKVNITLITCNIVLLAVWIPTLEKVDGNLFSFSFEGYWQLANKWFCFWLVTSSFQRSSSSSTLYYSHASLSLYCQLLTRLHFA